MRPDTDVCAALREANNAIYRAARLARKAGDSRAEELKAMALASDDLVDRGQSQTNTHTQPKIGV